MDRIVAWVARRPLFKDRRGLVAHDEPAGVDEEGDAGVHIPDVGAGVVGVVVIVADVVSHSDSGEGVLPRADAADAHT